jgi:hypothetical protein
VQSALKKVKNESLLDRFEKKSTKKTDELDEISQEFKKSESMFKTAATHIESHIPEISSAKDHAKVIEKALHANDYFVDHAKDVNAIADEVLSKGCEEDLAAEFHHEFSRKTPIEIPVAEVTPYEPPALEPLAPVEAPPAPVEEYVPPPAQPTGLAKLLEESAGEDQRIPLNNIPVSLPEPVIAPAQP